MDLQTVTKHFKIDCSVQKFPFLHSTHGGTFSTVTNYASLYSSQHHTLSQGWESKMVFTGFASVLEEKLLESSEINFKSLKAAQKL